ncbi:MAG: nucleotidyltransferase domain-containing protein [Deltaproteobacteria bacterium]|nr:nucleotidyltransferase domain-containing protein [Deltaproteobacteria bacterium]
MQFRNHLINLLADPVKIRVYQALSLHTVGLTGRALGQIVETSPFKINQVLKYLVEQGLVIQTVLGKAHRYSLNLEHVFIKSAMMALLKSEKDILKNMGRMMTNRLSPKPLAIILYGSVARGDEGARSDLDLLVVFGDRPPSSKVLIKKFEDIPLMYGNFPSITCVGLSDFLSPDSAHQALMRHIKKEGKSIAGLSVTALISKYGHKS